MTISKYVGLPYKDNGRDETGIDCWGLAKLYYKQELGIDLPSYSLDYNGETRENISELVTQQKEAWLKVTKPKVNDIIVFNIYGEPTHIGIYLGDNNFLHARNEKDSAIESINSVQWSKRISGYYRYVDMGKVAVTGMPHPLQTKVESDWIVPGATLLDFSNFIIEKYGISQELMSHTVIMLDGVPVPKELWATTVAEKDQAISYRAVAGKEAGRLILTIIVAYIAFQIIGPAAGTFIDAAGAPTAATATTAATTASTSYIVASSVAAAVTQVAGMALINAVMPIRPPTQNDPGQARGVNLFNGSSNQSNRFGAIPVVLGKVRMAAMLGAAPYVETLPDTSIINLLLIWGFGPLEIDDIQVGGNQLEFFYDNITQSSPIPINIKGYAEEYAADSAAVAIFNKAYGVDIEQQFPQRILVNNPDDGNPWALVSLEQEATSLDVSLSFPEGMRQIIIKGEHAGDINPASAEVEIQYRINTGTGEWFNAPNYAATTDTGNAGAFTIVLPNVSYASTVPIGNRVNPYGYPINLYRWYTLALGPGHVLASFAGTATQGQNEEPDADLITMFKNGSYANLVGSTSTYSRLPAVPSGYVPLYNVCVKGGTGFVTGEDLRSSGDTSVTGLNLIYHNLSGTNQDGNIYTTGQVRIDITSGVLDSEISNTPIATVQEIFTSLQFAGVTSQGAQDKEWCPLMTAYSVWDNSVSTMFTRTQDIEIPVDGYYTIEGAVDDYGDIYLNNSKILTIPTSGYKSVATSDIFIKKGTHSLRVIGTNTGGKHGFACRITYNPDSQFNAAPRPSTTLEFGTTTNVKAKNAFNFTYKIRNLPKERYEIRVRRANSDIAEPEGSEYHNYFAVMLFSVTAYDNKQPAINPPNCYLAKTALSMQSTSKANGTINGVNALVQTIAKDWDGTNWTLRATNNPASLFLYVLTHPANAYRVKWESVKDYVDLDKLQHWHAFCSSKKFSYNNVLSNTQSVMDTLRDIAASGMASTGFVNGKWTVVIDEPRTAPVQHFTPHNSWGFEATKVLPRMPDAFRVTFLDETIAFQPKEIFVYKPGLTQTAGTEIFEELRLPGVTNYAQAEFFAKWHFAQLKMRPEVYSFNTDFEYLICSRGDWVKVAHDVPMWGGGTGRLHSVDIQNKVLHLTESVYLEVGKSYVIRIRTNTAGTSNSKELTIATVTSSGSYTSVTVTDNISNMNIEPDNLFMFGELHKETQDLIVLSVEPMGGTSAKLTLVDYSPSIYNEDFNNLVYNPNITGKSIELASRAIKYAPVITSMRSDNDLSESISSGNYQNVLLISFANPGGLGIEATKIETQVILGDASFNNLSSPTSYTINKEVAGLTIHNTTQGLIYKARARYTNGNGTIAGPWSEESTTTIDGKNTNYQTVATVNLSLERTYIVASPANTANKPDNFKTYEYRCYRDTGLEDFWELDPTTNGIKVTQSLGSGRFNLLDFSAPRMTEAGVTYRVACRALDNNNNYSAESALGTLVVATIK